MPTKAANKFLIADRIWIATALLHRQFPARESFTREDIRDKMQSEGLANGVQRGTVNAHLKEHCVANVPPSSGKYRMLFEPSPGKLRLWLPGDPVDRARLAGRKLWKSIPHGEEIPRKYRFLLDWYENWCGEDRPAASPIRWEDDPLIQLIGSGKHIWADEHADEYVENLRREDI